MLRKFHKKKGQNVAEYAILIAIVIGAIIAMQTFVKRTFQARLRGAAEYMVSETNADADNFGGFGNGIQYEPYYSQSEYNVDKTSQEVRRTDNTTAKKETFDVQTRGDNGYQATTFNVESGIGAQILPDAPIIPD